MSELSQSVSMWKFQGGVSSAQEDLVAHEEPLELQVDGQSLAVLMRTRGHDEELGTGFLRTEGLIDSLSDLESIRHCTTFPSPEAEDNVLQIRFAPHVRFDLAKVRRHFFATSSCGVCGKATIENALRTHARVESETRVTREVLRSLPDVLRAGQVAFDETGGLHGAALFDASGKLQVLREDVGRHNAVDKVVGWATRTDLPTGHSLLMVSGRLSFELVQKCVAARIPILAGISAPTSLAVEMADALGITLIGFLRSGSMNVYANPLRLH